MQISTIHRLAFLGILLPLVCGCVEESQEPKEEVKPDYITVVVRTTGVCMAQDLQGVNHSIPNVVVKVDIVKAGGQTKSFEATTDESGQFHGQDATFELYREQPITCTGVVIGGHEDLPYTFTRKTLTLTWAEVYSVKDFGETYTWAPHLIVFGSE